MDTNNLLLTDILKNVSRAFYLSMRILPAGVREPISLGYLLARAADTIADTPGIEVKEKLYRLQVLLGAIQSLALENDESTRDVCLWGEGATLGEQKLLQLFPQVLELTAKLREDDRCDVQNVVSTLISGMILDLSSFPGRFTEISELDRYTYLVAGCVGEFWSRVIARHTSALKGWNVAHWSKVGVRFGKALQLTNILRDAVKDLENGRSYIPGLIGEGWLNQVESEGIDYYESAIINANNSQINDILAQWLEVALHHYKAAIEYILSLPWHCWRLRLSVIWPVAIGLATLAKLSRCSKWLTKGHRVKVERRWVYRMIALTVPLSLCNFGLKTWLDSWWLKVWEETQRLRKH